MTIDNLWITDRDALDVLERLSSYGQRIVLVRNRERETVYVSENAQEITGWTLDEFSRNVYSIIHDEDLPAVLTATRAIRNDGAEERRLPVRTFRKDGSMLEFDLQALNRLDDPGINGLVVVLTPLAPILESTNRWTALLALDTELLLIQRGDPTKSSFVSPSYQTLLGYSATEILENWELHIHPDDVEELAETAASVLGTPRAEARMRVRIRHADGHWLTIDSTFANHLDDPLIDGLMIRGRDVSDLVAKERELEEAASRFEAIVTNGPGATVLVDPDTTVTFCSAGIRQLLGYEPDELVGTRGIDLVHPDDVDEALRQLELILEDPHGPDPTLRVRHADGHDVWVGITAVNQLDHPVLGALVLSLRNRGAQMETEHRVQRLLRDASGATFVIKDRGQITWTTPGIEKFLGDGRMMSPAVVRTLASEQDAAQLIEMHRRVIRNGDGATERYLCRLGPTEEKVWADLTITNANRDATIEGTIVNIHDVDEAVRAGESGNRLTAVLENTTDFVSIFDGELDLIWRNPAASAVFGNAPQSAAEVLTQVPETTRRLLEDVIMLLDQHGSWRGEFELRPDADTVVPVEVTILVHDSAGGERYYSMMGRDITDRRQMESRLEARARHDQLTGLPNRLFLSEQLGEALAQSDDLAVLFIDLDQFKAVNDSQGHDAGDRLLITAAERLRAALRPTDIVARFGGDEFVVLLPGVSTVMDALPLAERVLAHLRGPVQLGQIPVYLTGSAGIAVADGSDATTLISNADAAMYRAKNQGRDRVAVFTSELRAQSQQRLETAHRLRSALDADELEVWFQPIVDTATGRPLSCEALVRWRHPVMGSVDTEHLIEVAEETGLILALGASVISRTCACMAALGDDAAGLTFSVNLSAHQLADPQLIGALEHAVAEYGVDPGRLVCEVTESAVMLDVDDSARVLDRIRALGVGIAIDDFGTGYSSLAYLQRFPVDVLKIDREFVVALTSDSDWKRSLAAGIISLGHSLGLRVLAEGVETSEQATILTMLGCDGMQGFLFSEALPVDQLPETIKRLRSSARLIG